MPPDKKIIKLPGPAHTGKSSLEETLLKRKSIRDYSGKPLSLEHLSQILWAAQGVTRDGFFRTAPSAGALYPVEIYVAVGEVDSLDTGIYRYLCRNHSLQLVSKGDVRRELARACLGQNCVNNGAAVLVIAAVYDRVTGKYGERGVRYAHIEAGNVSQNIYLQAASLKLGTVLIGAFYDEKVREVMKMNKNETPLCVMPAGKQ